MLENPDAPSPKRCATMSTHQFRITSIVFGDNADIMPNVLFLLLKEKITQYRQRFLVATTVELCDYLLLRDVKRTWR